MTTDKYGRPVRTVRGPSGFVIGYARGDQPAEPAQAIAPTIDGAYPFRPVVFTPDEGAWVLADALGRLLDFTPAVMCSTHGDPYAPGRTADDCPECIAARVADKDAER